MRTIKEKPKTGKRKSGTATALSPRLAAKLLKERYVRQLDQRREGPEREGEYAIDRVEAAGRFAMDELAEHLLPRQRDRRPREKAQSRESQQTPGQTPPPGREQPPATIPREQAAQAAANRGEVSRTTGAATGQTAPQQPQATPAIKERPANAIKEAGSQRRAVSRQTEGPVSGGRQTAGMADGPGQRAARRFSGRGTAGIGPPRPQAGGDSRLAPNTGRQLPRQRRSAGIVPKGRGAVYNKTPSAPKAARTPFKTAARPVRAAGGAARQRMTQRAVRQAGKTAKGVAAYTRKLVRAVTKAAAALVSALTALVGGAVLLFALVIVIVIAAVASSPFGLFFAEERSAPDTVSVAEAVAQVNSSYNARLETLQAGCYDGIEITGQAPDWPDVLAVFASRYAGAEDGVDVATLDADRVGKLTAVFWDMTALTSWVEDIDHPGDDDSEGWTEYILHISISAKTAADMRTAYAFTDLQNSALDELLADRAALAALTGSLNITSADAQSVLEALPDDLAPERRAVVETALRLYGKVGYFWGGKSLVLGWDSRWGQLTKVTAAGSTTTGTYRPYGLDCSGYADWVFYNASGGSYIIGHGGGARMQHTYCTDISWDEALPGDLVFYPEDEHVGIVCGYDGNGGLLVIHCASGANNVVITGVSGFTSIARPQYYRESIKIFP